MHSNWTGFDGIEQEDAIIAISMGPILDSTKEHMVAADRAVIHLRLRLLQSVRRHEDGEQPIGLGVDVERPPLAPRHDHRGRRSLAGARARQRQLECRGQRPTRRPDRRKATVLSSAL